MSTGIDKLAKELKEMMSASDDRKPSPYDTQAEVLRIDGDTAWVHIPGGVQETPVRLTINAKKGDIVNIHIADGSAWITGNGTNPPTDDTTANIANNTAVKAMSVGEMAMDDARRASVAANIAEASADEAADAATAASNMANQAQYNLSEIERVVDVVNWISEHGEYDLTSDTEPIPGKFYFEKEGSTFISITVSPDTNPQEEGLYELKDVNSSISKYIASHISLDDYGLVIKTDGIGSTVRISSSGVILTNNNGEVVSTFSEAVRLGDAAGAHVTLSTSGLEFWYGPEDNVINKVAYVSANTLKITQAQIETSLRIGKFMWKTQSDHRISLVYVP